MAVIDFIAHACLAGQAFSTTTGKLTSGGSVSCGVSLFNPATSGKTLYIYSLRIVVSGSNQHSLVQDITTDPALSTGTLLAVNRFHGRQKSVVSATYQNSATSFTGNTSDFLSLSGNTPTDYEFVNDLIICPPGSGVGLLIGTASNVWGVSVKWCEL